METLCEDDPESLVDCWDLLLEGQNFRLPRRLVKWREHIGEETGSLFFTSHGPQATTQRPLFTTDYSLLTQPTAPAVLGTIETHVNPWTFLAQTPFLSLDEAVLTLIDRRHHLYYWLYRLVWDLRQNPSQALFDQANQWLTGNGLLEPYGWRYSLSWTDRGNALGFLLHACWNNGWKSTQVVHLTGMDQVHKPAITDLMDLIQALGRWNKMTALPLGIVLEHPGSLHDIHQQSPRLANFFKP